MNSSIIDEIEAEYDAYCLDEGMNLDSMYEKLYQYLRGFVAMILRNAGHLDENALDEVAQETLTAIATDKIYTFHKKEAKFTTFCTAIAKNKAFDYVRRSRYSLCSYSEAEEQELFRFSSRETYCDPEKLLIKQEQRLEQIEAVKKYLHRMVSQKGKPYRTVGCCYTMVLFHRHNPGSKELSSPKWAFETVREDTVEESADNFIDEMNEWFPRLHLYWGDAFLDGMEEREEGVYISDMIFGEHFKVKDFENWSLRLRQKMREELIEEVCEVLD
ncbi:MAG: hypothetical protein NC313_02415 [Butyrivibrio sp.]|nr:hypothetical protein [Butyrivibrio sp.]